jgi:4-amino-4-deoxy-L-arabinose transferase-like glycosyltransferase
MVFVALIVNRRAAADFFRQHKETSLFILGWVVLMLIVFSCANHSMSRYMLPAYPLLCVLSAALIMSALPEEGAGGVFSVGCNIILGAGLAI